MTIEEFAITSLIIRVKYMSLKKTKKKKHTKTINKENKYTNKTNVLSFCLGSFWFSNLLGLRNGGV